jgi:hypothetical protein
MTAMTEMTLHAELPEGADAQKLAEELRGRLADLSEVNEVVAAPEAIRSAAEVLAAIAITVSIIKGAGDIAAALHDAIPKIKLVLRELRIVKAQIEVVGELVSIDEVTVEHTRRIRASVDDVGGCDRSANHYAVRPAATCLASPRPAAAGAARRRTRAPSPPPERRGCHTNESHWPR